MAGSQRVRDSWGPPAAGAPEAAAVAAGLERVEPAQPTRRRHRRPCNSTNLERVWQRAAIRRRRCLAAAVAVLPQASSDGGASWLQGNGGRDAPTERSETAQEVWAGVPRGALTCTCLFPARQCGQTETQSQTPTFSVFSKPEGDISGKMRGMGKAVLVMASLSRTL